MLHQLRGFDRQGHRQVLRRVVVFPPSIAHELPHNVAQLGDRCHVVRLYFRQLCYQRIGHVRDILGYSESLAVVAELPLGPMTCNVVDK